MKRFPATVVALGVVSFFTDFSSEMIYPLLPVFLADVLGAGAVVLGVVEGFAEATAGVLKVASGYWTDRVRRRKPLIFTGYTLAGAVRPLIGLATAWPFVLVCRFFDRVGKGLRTSPRDALIADVTDADMRGAAFGLHRAMDHGGAVVGPLAAAGLLMIEGVPLRHVFFLAAVPAAVVVIALAVFVKEPARKRELSGERPAFKEHWGELGRDFRVLLLALVIFTLGNSTDAFLLLRLKDAGVPTAWVALLWSAIHVVKMTATYVGGRLSDRVGRRPMVLAGWALYALVYLLFAWVEAREALIAVFLCYGLFYGLTEPTERAWVTDLVPARLRGTAFGYYNGVVGLMALPASVLFGLLWDGFGAHVPFIVGACLAAVAAAVLFAVKPTHSPRTVS